jgi:hypothetical protein
MHRKDIIKKVFSASHKKALKKIGFLTNLDGNNKMTSSFEII